MWPAAHPSSICSPADALFVSALQRSDELGAGQIQLAIAAALRAFGAAGCAGRVAQEFGDHPDTAAPRMRWARSTAARASSAVPGLPTAVPGLSAAA
jgi:hypothetical protein